MQTRAEWEGQIGSKTSDQDENLSGAIRWREIPLLTLGAVAPGIHGGSGSTASFRLSLARLQARAASSSKVIHSRFSADRKIND
jgi:hypothetical protein